MSGQTKVCTLCGEDKPLEDYYRCSAVSDGRAARCKTCRDAAHREYYAAHAEGLRAYGREQRRRWSAANPEKQRDLNRRGAKSPAGIAATKRKKQKRREAGVPWGGAAWERDRLVVLERDDGVCGICGGDVDPVNYTLDHVVPIACGGRHVLTNLQLAHRACNSRKHTAEMAP